MPTTEPVTEESYLTDAFGREAVAFVERHKAEPWFLYLAFNAVHTPMQADDPRLAKLGGGSIGCHALHIRLARLRGGLVFFRAPRIQLPRVRMG